jgi:phenylpropionate dioxygenase-like ring-hydroxylating dioxygenase large terminal subunit
VHKQSIDTGMFTEARRDFYAFEADGGDAAFPRAYNRRHFELNVTLHPDALAAGMAMYTNRYPVKPTGVDGYLHAFLYPNMVFVSYLGLWYSMARYIPLGPDKTRIAHTIVPAVQPPEAREPITPDYAQYQMQASVRVYKEDLGVCETVQQGLLSSHSRAGYYGQVEAPMYHFEQAYLAWLAVQQGSMPTRPVQAPDKLAV